MGQYFWKKRGRDRQGPGLWLGLKILGKLEFQFR